MLCLEVDCFLPSPFAPILITEKSWQKIIYLYCNKNILLFVQVCFNLLLLLLNCWGSKNSLLNSYLEFLENVGPVVLKFFSFVEKGKLSVYESWNSTMVTFKNV